MTSDDSKWCKERFSQPQFESFSPSIVYTVDLYPTLLQKYLDTYNLFDCTNEWCIKSIKKEYAYFDLAVLSSMNYYIYDYGSYGFWGAYLSQSKIIIHVDENVTDIAKKLMPHGFIKRVFGNTTFGPSTMEILLSSSSH